MMSEQERFLPMMARLQHFPVSRAGGRFSQWKTVELRFTTWRSARVSPLPLSRALCPAGSISAKSRQKVQEAIEALHYQPSTAHSHPQGQEKRTGTLALVIGDFDNPYCSMLMRGAELEATRHGYALEVFCHTPGTITNDQMIRRLLEHRPDGVALTGGLVEDGPAEVILDNLKQLHHAMPVVTIGPLIEGMSSINIASDSFEGVRKVMTHLTNLGHRRIAFIGGRLNTRFSDARITMYRQEMTRLGVPAGGAVCFPHWLHHAVR